MDVLTFLDAADLARMSRTCSALRYAPSHFDLWRALALKRFPTLEAPTDGHWKREFHWRLVVSARAAAYQRDMMLGLLGRRSQAPEVLDEPRVDVFTLDASGSSRPVAMMATRRLRAKLRLEAAAVGVGPAASPGAVASRDVPMTEVRRGLGDQNETSDAHRGQLRIRQGSAPWSALG